MLACDEKLRKDKIRMKTIIGIDIGGSTTKIIGFREEGGVKHWLEPLVIVANDPLTATYGAFGRFADENRLALSDISRVMITGVGASHIKTNLYGLDCRRAEEFQCIGRGGSFLSGLEDALIVSMGTGTAIVHAMRDNSYEYIGGTGVGGGTLMGLSRLMLNAETVSELEALADGGNLNNIDLKIKDLVRGDALSGLSRDLTASNFANIALGATKDDIALGIMNLVFETVGMVSIFAARSRGVQNIVLTGNVTTIPQCIKKYEEFNSLGYGVKFTIPERSGFATAIGAALIGSES
jgi:type II pantothenate kinase